MTILQNGLNRIRDLHKDDADKIWLGTDGSVVTESQTGLQSGVSDTKIAFTSTQTDKQNKFLYTLPSTTGIGNTYREVALINDGTVEYTRVTMTGIEHTSNEDFVITKKIFYRNP